MHDVVWGDGASLRMSPPVIAAAVATEYVRALQDAPNPLVSTKPLVTRRSMRAERVILDVLASLGYGEVTAEAPDPWSLLQDMRSGGASPTDVIDASGVLFTIAFRSLTQVLLDDYIDIATTLSRRLSEDIKAIAEVLTTTNALDIATREVIDRAKLRSVLSPQQAAVFELKCERRTTTQIATELRISEKTVKNHVTDIDRRLEITDDLRSWNTFMARAREVGLLIVLPVLPAAAFLTDAGAAISGLL